MKTASEIGNEIATVSADERGLFITADRLAMVARLREMASIHREMGQTLPSPNIRFRTDCEATLMEGFLSVLETEIHICDK